MKNVLVINSSLQGKSGNSSKLSQMFVEKLTAHQEVKVNTIDLNDDSLSHLSAEEMQAWQTPEEDRNEQQSKLANVSNRYIQQVLDADYIVLGVPMYNFGNPSVLKAFFDRLARAGVTFAYTENGPKGLIENKKAFVLMARGGKYKDTLLDTQTPYLRNFLAFLGISDVHFVYAEGLAMGDESVKNSFASFSQSSEEIISGL